MSGPTDGVSVLAVAADGAAVPSFADTLAAEPSFDVTCVTGLSAARTALASSTVDCVVVDAGALGADATGFFADVETIAPGVPTVLVATGGAASVSDAVIERATTFVEGADGGDDWALLVAKVRASVDDAPAERDHHETYRMLVESARDGLYRLDAAGDVVYANESFAAMLGYDRSEILGNHGSWALADDELERGQSVIGNVLADDDRESEIVDMDMIRKDGERITIAVHFVVLTTADGGYGGVVGVARDVTERRNRERELERKNDRLEEFASMVSHDIRNPLNVAQGHLELAAADGDDEHLAEVATSLDRMSELVEDLLVLAREGKRVDEVEPVDLEALVTSCWRSVAPAGATLDVDAPVTVAADRTRLRQLVENLLGNAVDHAGADVAVTVGELEDGFVVADDGPGIPVADRERVLEAGYSTRDDGTGFGLAIVRDVAEAHGWTVTVGESSDGGARFEVRGVDRYSSP